MSLEELLDLAEIIAADGFCANVADIVEDTLIYLLPPEKVLTVDCAERFRKLPGNEDGAVVSYDRMRTPYNVGPMNSLDNPGCKLMVMVKPSRSGGTTVVENYEFKMMRFGPMGHIAHVLNSDEAVTDYCRSVVKPMFELNSELQERVGKMRGDDTDSFKRVANYPVEWLSAKDSTFRNRQPLFMVSDETDGWSKKYAKTPKVQIEGRQKLLGNRRKGAILSHPDLGWSAGVAACFEDTSRGIYIMRCAECGCYAAAYATKFWDNVPEFKLSWPRNKELPNDERLTKAATEAAMYCPHCGAGLTDEQRRQMVDDALTDPACGIDGWMHRGQTLDALQGVLGEMEPNDSHGFWVHGLMVKAETLGKLAREYEAALIKFERTKDTETLKEFLSKHLCEVFEGAATTGGVSARALKQRVQESTFLRGVFPQGPLFITASVDTGGRQFDVAWLAWDLEGRSWLLDRLVIRQRLHDDGILRDIRPGGDVDDWLVLLTQVLDRRFPIAGRPGWEMPVAAMCVDSGDGNVTEKARAFARRAERAGYKWGGWSKVKLIKGVAGKRPIIPDAPRKIDKDEMSKPITPVIFEYSLGVDQLKSLTLERLAVADGTAGQCHFPAELEDRYVDQFFGENFIDGKWVRSGPNEQLDLYGYAEAARLMLKPDREGILWDQSCMPAGRKWHEGLLPVWAQPVPVNMEGGDPAVGREGAPVPKSPPPQQAAPKSIFERFDALNRDSERDG
jgi:phage terminase large subunit GpA-like protein